MKTKAVYLVVTCLGIMLLYLTSCSKEKEEDKSTSNTSSLQEILIEDLVADTGGTNHCTFFSLERGMEVEAIDSASEKWDIAFRRTEVYINGGSSGPGGTLGLVVDGIFNEIATAPEKGYTTDTETTKVCAGWYNYTGSNVPEHAILMIPGKVLIFKTSKGYFAKLEILSYYKGNPDTSTPEFANLRTRSPSRYYTFKYVIQKDGTNKL